MRLLREIIPNCGAFKPQRLVVLPIKGGRIYAMSFPPDTSFPLDTFSSPQDEINALPPELQDLVNREVERRLALAQSEVELPLDDLPILQQIGEAPRNVSLTTRLYLRLCSVSAQVLGWVFAIIGLALVLIAAYIGLDDVIPRMWNDAGVGIITGIEEVNVTINDQEILAYHFEAIDDDGETIYGTSYGYSGNHEVGNGVSLQKAGKRYRIEGLTQTSGGILFTLMFFGAGILFGGIGICFPIYSWFTGGKAIQLLRDGTATGARFLDMKPTGTVVNGMPLMNVSFEYQVDGEKHTASAYALDTSRLTDTPCKAVLYDPMQPKRSIVLDGLPSGVRFDELAGQFYANPLRCVLPLLAATIVGGQIVAIVVLAIRAV